MPELSRKPIRTYRSADVHYREEGEVIVAEREKVEVYPGWVRFPTTAEMMVPRERVESIIDQS